MFLASFGHILLAMYQIGQLSNVRSCTGRSVRYLSHFSHHNSANILRPVVVSCEKWNVGLQRQGRRNVRLQSTASSRPYDALVPPHDNFADRHIGPRNAEIKEMLRAIGAQVGPSDFLVITTPYPLGLLGLVLSMGLLQAFT